MLISSSIRIVRDFNLLNCKNISIDCCSVKSLYVVKHIQSVGFLLIFVALPHTEEFILKLRYKYLSYQLCQTEEHLYRNQLLVQWD